MFVKGKLFMDKKVLRYNFWAKKREEKGQFLWLPLMQHLEDTKNVAGLLWEHWLGEGQKALIIASLKTGKKDEKTAKQLAQFLAAVHDIGKATPVFQSKKGYANSKDLDLELLEKLERAGFEGISSITLANPEKSPHALAGQYILHYNKVKEDIATIVGGHHGKPVDDRATYKNQRSQESNYYQSGKSGNTIYQKWERAQEEILNWALEVSGFKSVDELPTIKQSAQVILSGLLIMADWIASNEDYFPLISIDEREVENKADRLSGFEKWKRSSLWVSRNTWDFEGLYQARFDFEPRDVQAVLSKTIADTEQPGIFILEAPMGIGKTEAALVATEQLAEKTDRNGIFFGLPTQATSNGIFPRIEKWLESIKEDLDDNISIQLVHGKAALNADFSELPKGISINIDDFENGSVIVNEWFSGRKTAVLDDFVVGTVDQFLMLALKQKHLALRHLGFSKKVVVIDEVHAYDAYMNQYLLEALRWMGAYGVPVIILSATLPAERREKLLKSYMFGMGKRFEEKEKEQLSKQLKTEAYPLITYNNGFDICQITEFKKGENKKILLSQLEEEDLLDTVKGLLSDGGVAGIIVNTVKRAQKIAKVFADSLGEDMVEIFHSGFIATERVRKEQELLKMIGKDANRPYRKIIIGTQVIEQSLDIDFDVMISDLAPMDLLIQRMGRLHRHKIDRPQKHVFPKFYVIGMNDDLKFEEGSSFVYGDYLLARTQYYLPDSINLPEDISILVQKVYDEKLELDYPTELLDKKYHNAKSEHETKIGNKESKARDYRIADPVLRETRSRKENLIGWLENSHPDDSDERAYAQVRDIEDIVEVIALKKVGDGYALFGEGEDLSELITDFNIAKKVAQNTLRLPIALTKSYNVDDTIKELEMYSRMNLNNWQDSSWLKGALGIIFDENNEFLIGGYKLVYDEKYGVRMEEIENHE